jgi:hypothetical protein
VIAVDQHSRESRQLLRSGSLVVWTATPESGGGEYLALFNLDDKPQAASYSWKDLGLPEGSHAVRDLWARKDLGPAALLKTELPLHGAKLYRVR